MDRRWFIWIISHWVISVKMPNYILDFGEITIATHPKNVKRLINKCKKEIKNLKNQEKFLNKE